MAERPTFSPFWHRVRAMKPRLRPHVQISRQFYRGRRWHVVRDPSSNQFYRLNPIAHELVGLFDGERTVEEVWKIVLERHGDAAPTQGEAIQLISQLYNSNLLAGDISPETEQMLQRGRERVKKKATQQAIGIMYFKIRVFNPDRYLSWIEPFFRPLINKWGFLAWLIFVVFAIGSLLPQWETLADGLDSALAPANWGWLIVVFIVTKAIHETGHGVICKRFGGQVPEFGFMLLVLFPAPYVDASSAWVLPSKWKRMAVGAGGMIFELVVAGIAALVWLQAPEGSTVRQVAYNAMFTASLSTILFNANPLMRFDGYFILSDLIEVPNLMQRSMKMLQHLWKVHVYRLKNETPPTSSSTEGAILITYGLLAMAYRVFLFISITLMVLGRLFAIGLVLAIWTGVMWFVLPVGKWVHWMATGSNIADCRARVIATSLASVALLFGSLGAIPFPDHRRASGVIESVQDPGVFFFTNGFVEKAHVRMGDTVREGQPLVTCSNELLESRLRVLRARISEARALEQQAMGRGQSAAAMISRERLAVLTEQADYIQEQLDRLVVRAPRDGRVVAQDLEALVGRFVEEGSLVCQVVDPSDLRIVALLDQQEAAWPTALGEDQFEAEVRLRSRVQESVPATLESIRPMQRELPHASFATAGGGQVETDQSQGQQGGMFAKNPQLQMNLRLAPIDTGAGEWIGMPGERVSIRFTLPDQPLLVQWLDRLHKMVQGKVNI